MPRRKRSNTAVRADVPAEPAHVGSAVLHSRLEQLTPYAFLAPAFLIVVGTLLYPLGYAVYFSFTDKTMTTGPFNLVGWDNYVRLLSDPKFWAAMRNTVAFTAVTGAATLTLGFFTALLMNRRFPMRGLYRTLLLLPWIMPPIVTGLTFRWLYNDAYGWLNAVLQRSGLIDAPLLFLVDPKLVWPSVIAANVWVEYPFVMLMMLAALQSINPDLYRAARVDGANAWQQFVHITLPSMRKALVLNALLQVIFMFKTFDLVWIITRGGPGDLTELAATLAYRHAFEGYQTGYGSAIAVIIFVCLFAASLVYLAIPGTRGEGL